MLIWYSLSVIGFDVHTCSGSGETYIATVIGGTACDDIHPEHDEPSCGCCHKKCISEKQKDEDGFRTKSCCTDDWQMIYLTGLRVSDDKEGTYVSISQLFPFAVCVLPDIQANLNFSRDPFHDFNKPRPKLVTGRACQEVYSVWRI